MKDNSKNRPTYISLFAGCGGFDIGFNENGFQCLGAYDISPYVVDVYKKNVCTKAHVHDLKNHNLPGINGPVDIVVAGSPCQGFSTIGKREINDPRNHLLLTGGHIAIKYAAKVFICENVLGSNSGKHKRYWQKLEKLLTDNEYKTKMVTYEVTDCGLPQSRKRIILYAWKSESLKNWNPILEKKQPALLSRLFANINEQSNHNIQNIKPEGDDFKIASRIKQGQKLCNVRGGERSVHTWDIPEVFGIVSAEEREFLILLMKLRRQIRRRDFGDADPVDENILKDVFKEKTKGIVSELIKKGYIKRVKKKYIELTHTFNGKFKRLSWDKHSPTVDTRFGHYKNFLHPAENRGMSVREAARIQGFKDDFIFYGPVNKQYEMIGNAVPPPLSFAIAKNVKNVIIPYL